MYNVGRWRNLKDSPGDVRSDSGTRTKYRYTRESQLGRKITPRNRVEAEWRLTSIAHLLPKLLPILLEFGGHFIFMW